MSNPNRKGQAGNAVSTSMRSSNSTPWSNTSFFLPHGLQLQQTLLTTGSVTIPTGITFVYAIVVGAGGGGSTLNGGGAGGIAWGWTISSTNCIVGVGAVNATGEYSRYGNVIAGGGGASATAGFLGGGGGAGGGAGSTNYWAIPLAGSAGGSGSTPAGNAISGGGGASAAAGSGLAGGSGSASSGGRGINILTGENYTPTGSGGAGIAANGSGTQGGLGGGGSNDPSPGGNGLIYLFY